MNKQALKLILLLNICFWFSVLFTYLPAGLSLPQGVVSTVVVLGCLGFLGNLFFGIQSGRKKDIPILFNTTLLRIFILISTLAQALIFFTSIHFS